MAAPIHEHRNYGFVAGFLTGTAAGAALALWLTPRSASELRARVADSAKKVGQLASDGYQQATTRVSDAVEEIARKGEDVRADVADAVTRGAQVVERYAAAAKKR